MAKSACFDFDCRRCARLASFLDEVREKHPDYYARPVPSFGPTNPRLLIVGLAPGMHGANRTGRPFTGDFAGLLLYETLHALGLSNQPTSSHRDDSLELFDCRIANAVKCLPPQNKPVGDEVRNCNDFLQVELQALPDSAAILALGRVAHEAVLRALGLRQKDFPFGHGNEHRLPDARWLVDSYHCSRYNTQTKRLTARMFRDVVRRARTLAKPRLKRG